MNVLLDNLPDNARLRFASLLTNHFEKFEAVYDFGCGDGFYLAELSKRIMGRLMGVDPTLEIADKQYQWITHPIDIGSPIHLGPPGNVLCIGIVEHISCERLPSLLENFQRHCKRQLVLVWGLPGSEKFQGPNCKSPKEVIKTVTAKGFQYNENLSEQWQDTVGDDLWWGRKQIYIFQRCANGGIPHGLKNG